jgi:hypothetical protein
VWIGGRVEGADVSHPSAITNILFGNSLVRSFPSWDAAS